MSHIVSFVFCAKYCNRTLHTQKVYCRNVLHDVCHKYNARIITHVVNDLFDVSSLLYNIKETN